MTSREPTERPAGLADRRDLIPLAAGAITIGFGLLTLIGWVFGWPLLASFGAGRIPMAPSTAVLFLLFGAAIAWLASSPESPRARAGGGVLVAAGSLSALLLLGLSVLNIHWAGEHLGMNVEGTVAGAPLGHMAMPTSVCFLLAGVSFLAWLPRSDTHRWRVALAVGVAGLLLAAVFTFLLAYAFGTPLLYGGRFIPPALNTILAFLALGVSLLALAHRWDGSARSPSGDDSRLTIVFSLIFALLAISIVASGYGYYRSIERQFRAETEQQLLAIAELKVSELVQYRRERLGDAATFADNPAFAHLVRRFLARPSDTVAREQLEAWLGKYESHLQYERIFVLDPRGVAQLSVPERDTGVSATIVARVAGVLRSGQPVFQDFYRHDRSQRIFLSVLVPIRDRADGDRPLGVVVLQIDPGTYLYPFIGRWPVPSRTAETLLVRREGNEVVYLNDLRFRPNAALRLRRPITESYLPAVRAALGHEGIVEGINYRDEVALAAVRAVPGSPWFLVALRERTEAYAPLGSRLRQLVGMLLGLLVGAGAVVALLWRRQRARFRQGQAALGKALELSELRLHTVLESVALIGLMLDRSGRILLCSDYLLALTGWSRAEVLGRSWFETFLPSEMRAQVRELFDAAIASGELPARFENEIVTRHRERRLIAWSNSFVRDADGQVGGVASIGEDITERRQAERGLIESEQRHRGLFENMSAGFVLFEVVLEERCVPADLVILAANRRFAETTGLELHSVIGQRLTHVLPGIEHDAADWIGRYGRIALTGEPQEFEQGSELLGVYYAVTAYRAGLNQCGVTFVDITERKRTEAALQESEERLRLSTEMAGVAVWEYRVASDSMERSSNHDGLYGLARQARWELNTFLQATHPDDRALSLEIIQRSVASGGPDTYQFDFRVVHPDATVRWLSVIGQVVERTPDGPGAVVRGCLLDVTDRKTTEDALRQSRRAALNLLMDVVEERQRREQAHLALRASEESYATLFREMQNGFAHNEIICDREGRPVDSRYLAVNPAFERITGRRPDEVLGKTLLEVFPALEPAWIDTFGRVALTGAPAHFEMRAESLGICFEVSAFQPAPGQYACTFSDVTARKHAEEALQQLNAELEQRVRDRTAALDAANKELEAFSYSVSHDLRAPLRSIDGFSRVVQEDYAARLDDEGRDSLSRIRAAAQRMGQLIEDLLKLSRVGRADLSRERVDLTALARDVAGELRQREPDRVVELVVAEGLTAHADHRLLRVVVENLLGNAWKFTGKRERAHVTMGAEQVNGRLACYIRDNGAGFDPAYAGKLFGAFQRLHGTEDFPGTGIGLATVRRIVDRHGGRVWAEGVVGQGATFWFDFGTESVAMRTNQ
ncbi:MAG: PAS domain S-box protein [Thermoanaerobaculia bacterium]